MAVNQKLVITEPYFPASSSNYGAGFPGTLGIPTLSVSSPPLLGSEFDVELGNSAGVPTVGILLAGFTAIDIHGSWGGSLLVKPVLVFNVSLDVSGGTLPVELAYDPTLAGLHVYCQGLEVDHGAQKKLSSSPGLELVLGLD